MRFAISAMAAISGLFLLGLAFYGQPALYLRQARDEWDVLLDRPAPDQPADPERDAVARRMALLQQKVTQLEIELGAKRVLAPQSPAPQPPSPAADQAAASRPENPGPLVRSAEAPQSGATGQLAPPVPPAVAPAITIPSVPAITIPERREAPGEVVTPIPEPAKADQSKPEPVKAPPQKLAALKTVPAPPPLPLQPRRESDDTRSVLARLRQLAPEAASVQQADTPPPVEPKPRPAPSPSLPRLAAARAALASGRIEDARRLLQEAQLQLVFRPVNADGSDLPTAAKGATDVAHALEALSANNPLLSRRYIDVAMGELSGNAANLAVAGPSPPIQESQMRAATGYAPAYPPR